MSKNSKLFRNKIIIGEQYMAFKYRSLMNIVFSSFLFAGFFISCTTNEILSPNEAPSIDFNASPLSRGVINSSNDMTDFSVWGWYHPIDDTSTEPTQVFDATTVSQKGNGWKYDNPQRWKKGNSYDFYAVYPSTLQNIEVSEGNIKVSDFDCSATGAKAIDLMTAENIGIEYIDETPGPVKMWFSHKLSRLKFTVKAEDEITVTVTNAKLYGVIYKGDYSSENGDTWSNIERYTETTTTFKYEPENPQPLTTTGIENIFSDILIIPNNDIEGAILELTYYYDEYNKLPVTKRINVKTNQIPGWEKGKNYSYTVTIGPNNIQFQPIVTPWNYSTGGIITVE